MIQVQADYVNKKKPAVNLFKFRKILINFTSII